MADTKVSALTAAVDLTSAEIAGQQGGISKRFGIALWNALFQPLLATLTSWGAITRASGFDTFVATPSSANLRALLTDEVGTGAAYFVGGALGTPASATLTNATGLPVAGGGTGVATITGIIKGNGTSAFSAATAGTDFYDPGGADVVVADGGTGRSSHTAYAVLCGGTTTTAAQQSIVSVGSAGQVLTSNGAGALPTMQTIPSGHTLLGTITTTSGASQSLSSLTLTSYSFLRCVLNGVSGTNSSTNIQQNSTTIGSIGTASGAVTGILEIDLNTGVGFFNTGGTSNTTAVNGGYGTGITTVDTSITFSMSAGTFDAGSIRVYGVV